MATPGRTAKPFRRLCVRRAANVPFRHDPTGTQIAQNRPSLSWRRWRRAVAIFNSLTRRFRDDRRGTTAVLFGLSVIPVMAIVGSAVDYGRASAARTELQRAVDAAALTLVRDAASLDEPKLKERGRSLVRGLLKEVRGFSADTITVSRNAKTIRVAASGTMKTAFHGGRRLRRHRHRLRGGIDLGLEPD